MRTLKYEGNRTGTVYDKTAKKDRAIQPGETRAFPDDVADWLLAHEPTLWSEPSSPKDEKEEPGPTKPPAETGKTLPKRKADK